jgi:hypothetical protein
MAFKRRISGIKNWFDVLLRLYSKFSTLSESEKIEILKDENVNVNHLILGLCDKNQNVFEISTNHVKLNGQVLEKAMATIRAMVLKEFNVSDEIISKYEGNPLVKEIHAVYGERDSLAFEDFVLFYGDANSASERLEEIGGPEVMNALRGGNSIGLDEIKDFARRRFMEKLHRHPLSSILHRLVEFAEHYNDRDPRSISQIVSPVRREVLRLFKEGSSIGFKDVISYFDGNTNIAKEEIKRLFGSDFLNVLRSKKVSKEEALEAADKFLYKKSNKELEIPQFVISDSRPRYGEQSVRGREDESVVLDIINYPRQFLKFIHANRKLQLASGHPPGFAFALFTRFGDGKKAVVTQIQSDVMSLVDNPVKRRFISGVAKDTDFDLLSEFLNPIRNVWPIVMWRNLYRKLREDGVEEVYLNSKHGLREIGASPPKSLVKLIMSDKFAKREGLGSLKKIDVGGVKVNVHDKPSPEVDKELIESYLRDSSMTVSNIIPKLNELFRRNRHKKSSDVLNVSSSDSSKDASGDRLDGNLSRNITGNVEGFDTVCRGLEGAYATINMATSGGYRLGESHGVYYIPVPIGVGRKILSKKLVKINRHTLFTSKSDAMNSLIKLGSDSGFSEGYLITLKESNIDGFYNVIGYKKLPVTKFSG